MFLRRLIQFSDCCGITMRLGMKMSSPRISERVVMSRLTRFIHFHKRICAAKHCFLRAFNFFLQKLHVFILRTIRYKFTATSTTGTKPCSLPGVRGPRSDQDDIPRRNGVLKFQEQVPPCQDHAHPVRWEFCPRCFSGPHTNLNSGQSLSGLPHSPMYKTHLFASKFSFKTRGASYTWAGAKNWCIQRHY